jgi:photoactive yellow protein
MNFFRRFLKLARFLGVTDIQEITPPPAENVEVGKQAELAPSSPKPVVRRFVAPDLLAQLPKLKPRELNALPFGCVQVDDSGVVMQYNLWEAEFAGVEQAKAIGVNFFRELAPCTNNRLVYGKFKDGIASGELDATVSYAFTYKMRPTLVDVHLYREPNTQTNWVLVQRAEKQSEAGK